MGHAAPSSSSSSAAPFARSLPRPGCIGVCVEGGGVLSLWLLSSGCFLIYFFIFPCWRARFPCWAAGSARSPAPKCPARGCRSLAPLLPLLPPPLGKLAPCRRLFSCLRPLCRSPAPACSSAAASWPARPSLTRLKSAGEEGRGEGEERPSHPEWLRAPRLRRGEGCAGMGNHERQHGLVPVPNGAGDATPRKLWLLPKNPADVSPGLAVTWDGRCGDGVAGAKPASLGWSHLTMAGPQEDGFTH